MSTFVRIRKHEDFVHAVDRYGMQTEVATASGVSIQRVNQLYSGRHGTVDVVKAAQLEDVLGVPRGSLFIADHGTLLVDYLGASPEPEQPDAAPGPDAPDAAPEDAPAAPDEDPRRDECAALADPLSARAAA